MSNFNPETPNQPVRHLFNPSVQGVTTGRTRQLGTTLHVQVQVSINDTRYFPFDELEANTANSQGIEDFLESLKFGKVGDLARILTYHKISSNLSNVFYAMQTSRTDFYSYQFKPVYKYIESLNGRILIADEVGLGKTIEAGLIWQETKARHPEARRLLVVCPSMLREKWKKELKDRFDVRAEIQDSKGFISLLDDFRREGTSFECAAICSLNTIRQDRICEAINDMHEAHRFDLVIIDEAHHLRNSETKSHHAGLLLSDATDSMVLLTATPIHLGSEDLYRLLRLLDSNDFSDLEIFRQRIEENEPLVRAQNLIRRYPPQIDRALDELNELKNSEWFRESELLALTEEQLRNMNVDDDTSLIEVGRRLEKLNLFSSVISRTRKREVLENRVIRQAKSISLEFTEQEREFYDAVTESVQKRMEGYTGNAFSGFAVMMPQRMMASSIPAMVEHYRQNSELDEELLDEMGILSDELNEDEKRGEIWLSLEQIVNEWDLNHPDSKYEKLKEVLVNRFSREPDVKIIIFSFFKKTLRYLNRRLAKEGFAPLKIDGDVPMEERQEIISQFKTDSGRRILLSSEVGSEGIDLQFCRVMVNYDLPWNPMKVEQVKGIRLNGRKAFLKSVSGADMMNAQSIPSINGQMNIPSNTPNNLPNFNEKTFVFEDLGRWQDSSNIILELDLEDQRTYQSPNLYSVSPSRPTFIANEMKEIEAFVVDSANNSNAKKTNDFSEKNAFSIETGMIGINLQNGLTDFDFKVENLNVETRIENTQINPFDVSDTVFEVLDWRSIRLNLKISEQARKMLGGRRIQFRISDKNRGTSDWYTIRQIFVRTPQITSLKCLPDQTKQCELIGSGINYIQQISFDNGTTWYPEQPVGLVSKPTSNGLESVIIPNGSGNIKNIKIRLRDYSQSQILPLSNFIKTVH